MLRRAVSKQPDKKCIVNNIIRFYAAANYVGTNLDRMRAGQLTCAPQPGHEHRHQWKPLFEPFGPIGVILAQLHEKGACMTADCVIHILCMPSIHVLTCILVGLKPAVSHIASEARTRCSGASRTRTSE